MRVPRNVVSAISVELDELTRCDRDAMTPAILWRLPPLPAAAALDTVKAAAARVEPVALAGAAVGHGGLQASPWGSDGRWDRTLWCRAWSLVAAGHTQATAAGMCPIPERVRSLLGDLMPRFPIDGHSAP